MKVIGAAVLCTLFCSVVSASSKVKGENRTAFFGEDIHIDVPPGDVGVVVFKPKTSQSSEVYLMRAGKVVNNTKAHINSLGHLVLLDVQEEDEGEYVIKNTEHPNEDKQLFLTVRDCALEEVVKYADNYIIRLNKVKGPITVEFRHGLLHPGPTETKATEPPPVVLINQTEVVAEEYVGRLIVSENQVTLRSVRMKDEGSYTVLDHGGKVRVRNCLNVREHQNFLHLYYGRTLKINLYLHHSNVHVVYRSKYDSQDQVILDRGVLVTTLDRQLEGRLSVEGSQLIMTGVTVADTGVFKVTDLNGFNVAFYYLQVDAYRGPPLTMAILSMLGLIAVMLLVCLLSCLCKIHKRKEKNKKLMLIAQQAGKGDGEAFRQVVHEAYTRFTEESLMQSVCEKTTESTEVTIKGLEVSKPGRYQALNSDNFLEMSDSGVEFTVSGLPLDSDTDVPVNYASHKPLLNAVSPTAVTEEVHSDSLEATLAPHGDLSASRTPDSVMSASPASHPRSLQAATPDGSLCGAASPGTASRGTVGSDLAVTEAGAGAEVETAAAAAESGEAEQKEGST